jgi:hypothetical protein
MPALGFSGLAEPCMDPAANLAAKHYPSTWGVHLECFTKKVQYGLVGGRQSYKEFCVVHSSDSFRKAGKHPLSKKTQ